MAHIQPADLAMDIKVCMLQRPQTQGGHLAMPNMPHCARDEALGNEPISILFRCAYPGVRNHSVHPQNRLREAVRLCEWNLTALCA